MTHAGSNRELIDLSGTRSVVCRVLQLTGFRCQLDAFEQNSGLTNKLVVNIFEFCLIILGFDIHDAGNPCLNGILQTSKTRACRRKEDSTFRSGTMPGRKTDRVLFCVNTEAGVQACAGGCVPGASGTSSFKTVLHTSRRTVVSSTDDVSISDDHCPDLASDAIRSLRNIVSDRHEIFVPRWTVHRILLCWA